MVAGLGIIELRLEGCRSLKEKRGLLKGLLNRTQREFNVSLAEVGDNDRWSKALIGFATVGNDRRHINGRIDAMIKFLEETKIVEIMGSSFELLNINADYAASEYEEGKYDEPAESGKSLEFWDGLVKRPQARRATSEE